MFILLFPHVQGVSSGIGVTIIDSSARPIDRDILRYKIRIADCILALYDVTRLETLDNLHNGLILLLFSSSTTQKKLSQNICNYFNKTHIEWIPLVKEIEANSSFGNNESFHFSKAVIIGALIRIYINKLSYVTLFIYPCVCVLTIIQSEPKQICWEKTTALRILEK